MTTTTMRARLRPVEAPRGAKKIPLDPLGAPRDVRNDVASLGYADATLPPLIVTVALVTVPDVAVELRTDGREVFVQDKFGALRMLKARAKAFLKRGEVLFFSWSKARGKRFGYVLEVERDATETVAVARDGEAVEAEVIDIASEEEAEARDGGGGGAARRARARETGTTGAGSAFDGGASRKSSSEGGDEGAETFDASRGWRRRSTERPASAKPSAGASAAASTSASARRASNGSRSSQEHARGQEYRDERQRYARDDGRREPIWGGVGSEEARQQADAARIPPNPPEGSPDDPPALQNARTRLKQAHHQLVEALNTEVAMRQTLAQSQLDVQRAFRSNADHSLRQWQKENLQVIAGKYQQSQFAAAAARSAYQRALHLFNSTKNGQHAGGRAAGSAGASTTSSKANENVHEENPATTAAKARFATECAAWETLLEGDPATMSLKELRKCATDIGVNTTTLVERDDYVNALLSKRKSDETAFKARKRKHEQEEAEAEAKRRARISSEAEESAKREALAQVNIWATHADLRLFLHRCGMKIDQHGRSTKRLLQKSYRQAMLRFHPDRARQKTIQEQALASEVTKWITHAWCSLPP